MERKDLKEIAHALQSLCIELFRETNKKDRLDSEKPEFKVWDYAVLESDNKTKYIKITQLCKVWDWFTYDFYDIKDLRSPTEEELLKFYR